MKNYLRRAGIDTERLEGRCGIRTVDEDRKCAYLLFRALMAVPYYDHSVVCEYGRLCENENEVLSFLYRKCGFSSHYVCTERKGWINEGYTKVYIGEDLFIADLTLSRALEWSGQEKVDESNFLMTLAEYGLKRRAFYESENEQ